MEFFDMLSTMDPSLWDQVGRGFEGATAASAAQGATAMAPPVAASPTPGPAPAAPMPEPSAPMAPPAQPPATLAPPGVTPPVATPPTAAAPGATSGQAQANNPFALSPDMIKSLMLAMGQGGQQAQRLPGGAAPVRGQQMNVRPPLSTGMPSIGGPGARRGF